MSNAPKGVKKLLRDFIRKHKAAGLEVDKKLVKKIREGLKAKKSLEKRFGK